MKDICEMYKRKEERKRPYFFLAFLDKMEDNLTLKKVNTLITEFCDLTQPLMDLESEKKEKTDKLQRKAAQTAARLAVLTEELNPLFVDFRSNSTVQHLLLETKQNFLRLTMMCLLDVKLQSLHETMLQRVHEVIERRLKELRERPLKEVTVQSLLEITAQCSTFLETLDTFVELLQDD